MPEQNGEVPSLGVIYARQTVVISKLNGLVDGQSRIEERQREDAQAFRETREAFDERLGIAETDIVRLQERQGILAGIQLAISAGFAAMAGIAAKIVK